MEYRRLGRTGLRVSVMGLGSGGRSRLGQAHGLEHGEITGIVRRALDLGVNLIDTAAAYGQSEELLGQALAGVPRDRYVMCTKFWPVRNDAMGSVEDLRASLERSLQRLQTDHVDVMYLHGIHPDWLERVLDRFWGPLQLAQREGTVRFLGVTENFQNDHAHEMLQALLPRGMVDVAMVGYNVLSAAPALHVLPLAQECDVGVVIMCAVRGVLLRPERIREVVAEWKAEGLLPRDTVPDGEPLGWLVGPWADSVPSAAYKFAAAHPAVSCVLTGTGRLAHLEQNVETILGTPLPPEIVQRAIDVFGPVSRNASF